MLDQSRSNHISPQVQADVHLAPADHSDRRASIYALMLLLSLYLLICLLYNLEYPIQDYTVFVRAVSPDGEVIAQRDSQPHDGHYPTWLWDAGEVLADEHQLAGLPHDVSYRLYIGMYSLATGERVPMMIDGMPVLDNAYVITPRDVHR